MTTPVNGILGRRGDEVGKLARIGADPGTPQSVAYPLSLLSDDNPAHVAKIPDTSGTIFWAHTAQTNVELFALIHHNLDEALSVRFGGGTLSAGTFVLFDVTIPAWLGSGVGRWPVNPWVDLRNQTPYSGTWDEAGYLVHGLQILGTNSQNIEIGQIPLYSDRLVLAPDLRWGMDASNVKRLDRPQVENVTRFRVKTKYRLGIVPWSAEGEIRADDALEDALVAHWHDADGKPFLLIPDGQVNRCYFVEYASSIIELPNQFIDWHDLKFAVQEAGRGLRPGL